MTAKSAARCFLAVGASIFVVATACGPADDPSPPSTTTDLAPPSARIDSELTDVPSSSLETGESIPQDPEAGSVAAGGSDELLAEVRLLVGDWRTAVSVASGVWPGYDLASIPAVLAVTDSDGVVGAVVAFNHPSPHGLGAVVHSLEIDGQEIFVIGEVADPDRLKSWAPIDLFATWAGRRHS